ncbi:MAG: hypothetical protein M3R60_08765 [Pseudomonadota bacterium]|nr:hypothetical protein [Pseudomonadota bacterium]
MMEKEKDYEQVGRFIYGAGRVGVTLALMMQQMGKPLVPAAPGERNDLAASAREADAMFARLAASDGEKAQFSALMQGLVALGGQLDLLDSLGADDFAAGADGVTVALDSLPRFGAIVDGLRA